MSDIMIKIKNLTKSYSTFAGEVAVLRGIDLEVQSGEFLAIMGASGSGKSTLMNILGCLDSPSGGIYELNGVNVQNLNKNALASFRNHIIGFVFQGFNLLQRMTLVDNIALPLVYAGIPREQRNERANAMLIKVGLEGYGTYRPNQISGGQQQRVAIARALINHPKLILADEPTGNLDTKTSQEIMELFSELNISDGITVILVTHEPDIAQYARHIIHVKDGQINFREPTKRMKEIEK